MMPAVRYVPRRALRGPIRQSSSGIITRRVRVGSRMLLTGFGEIFAKKRSTYPATNIVMTMGKTVLP